VANTAEIGGVDVTKFQKISASTRRVVLGFAPHGTSAPLTSSDPAL
jgi:misacylated tRNA(Ala) deacylase